MPYKLRRFVNKSKAPVVVDNPDELLEVASEIYDVLYEKTSDPKYRLHNGEFEFVPLFSKFTKVKFSYMSKPINNKQHKQLLIDIKSLGFFETYEEYLQQVAIELIVLSNLLK